MQRGHREHLTSPWPHLLRLSTTSGPRPLQPQTRAGVIAFMQLQAFHNQRPQAIAATGFPQPCGRKSFPTQAFHAATCHVQGWLCSTGDFDLLLLQ